MEKINQVWPKWQAVEILGQGGFGTVYKAKRENFGEVSYSAIKVVQIPKNKDEVKEMTDSGMSEEHLKKYYYQSVRNLVNEIRLMENLKSASNIVGIEDYEVVENTTGIGWTIYIRMELLTNLSDYLRKNAYDYKTIVQMGIDVLTALEFCHEQKIIHRDIKPANIFVSKFGQFKLGDFGVSRETEKSMATMSQKGTKSYMAPEMIRMEKYGLNVDMYALGLTMYELLNHGRMPFLPPFPEPFYPEDREEAMVKRLTGEPFPNIEGLGKLNEILKKACHFAPYERYQSAKEMKKDLLAVLNVENDVPGNNESDHPETLVNDATMGGNLEIPFEKTTKTNTQANDVTIGANFEIPFENTPKNNVEDEHTMGIYDGKSFLFEKEETVVKEKNVEPKKVTRHDGMTAFGLAKQAFERHAYKEAYQLLLEALHYVQEHPNVFSLKAEWLHVEMAVCMQYLGKEKEAIYHLRQAFEMGVFNQGQTLSMKHQHRKSVEFFDHTSKLTYHDLMNVIIIYEIGQQFMTKTIDHHLSIHASQYSNKYKMGKNMKLHMMSYSIFMRNYISHFPQQPRMLYAPMFAGPIALNDFGLIGEINSMVSDVTFVPFILLPYFDIHLKPNTISIKTKNKTIMKNKFVYPILEFSIPQGDEQLYDLLCQLQRI